VEGSVHERNGKMLVDGDVLRLSLFLLRWCVCGCVCDDKAVAACAMVGEAASPPSRNYIRPARRPTTCSSASRASLWVSLSELSIEPHAWREAAAHVVVRECAPHRGRGEASVVAAVARRALRVEQHHRLAIALHLHCRRWHLAGVDKHTV
jgi:hypothetical protein